MNSLKLYFECIICWVNDFLCYTKHIMVIYPIYIMSSEWPFIHCFPKNTSVLTEFLWNLQNLSKNGWRNIFNLFN